MEVSDEELLAQFVAGDASAFSQLVSRHRDRTYAICWRFFRNDADAEDATQEAFLRLYRRASSFRGGARFSTWMYRLSTNVCKDLHRRRVRRPQTTAIDIGDADGISDMARPDRATMLDAVAAADLRLDMRAALLRLKPDQRTALVLHVLLGYSYADIAEHTGVAIGTVKSRIHRGTAALDAQWRSAGTTAPHHPSESRPVRSLPTDPTDP